MHRLILHTVLTMDYHEGIQIWFVTVRNSGAKRSKPFPSTHVHCWHLNHDPRTSRRGSWSWSSNTSAQHSCWEVKRFFSWRACAACLFVSWWTAVTALFAEAGGVVPDSVLDLRVWYEGSPCDQLGAGVWLAVCCSLGVLCLGFSGCCVDRLGSFADRCFPSPL